MTTPAAQLYGGVLIGGASSRMGRPKHLLEIDRQTLLERIVAALRPNVRGVILIGAGEIPAPCAGLLRIPDAAGERGPLAGMLGAMGTMPDVAWVFVACDLPRIEPDAVAWVISQRRADAIAVQPRSPSGRIEPLFALYEPAARGPLAALAEARRGAAAPPRAGEKGVGPRLLADRNDVATPLVPAELAACWTNVNTPDDWSSATGPHVAD